MTEQDVLLLILLALGVWAVALSGRRR